MKNIENNIVITQPFMTNVADRCYFKKIINDKIYQFYTFDTNDDISLEYTEVADFSWDIQFCKNKNTGKIKILATSPCVETATKNYIEKDTEYFCVNFTSGYTPCFVADNDVEQECHNITNHDFFKKNSLGKKIFDTESFEDRQKIFKTIFLKHENQFKQKTQDELFEYLRKEILNKKGNITIEKLADGTGYSLRYVKKVFTEHAKIPPKLFCRIVRFQCLINRMNSDVLNKIQIDFVQYATDYGFSDQSHMIREVKGLYGKTPAEYLKDLYKIQFGSKIGNMEIQNEN